MVNIKKTFNTALSQVISTDGNFLFIGNVFGDIFVYSIQQVCYYPDDAAKQSEIRIGATEPIQIFNVSEKSQVQSLAFYKNFLIVGTVGFISGYNWSSKTRKLDKKSWEVKIPATPDVLDIADVNSLYIDKIEGKLYAGCGDNILYCISLEDGQILRNFVGHKDYIHAVHGCGDKIVTASEDGTIKFWDNRQKRSTEMLEPYKNESLNRSNFGKWQGTVSVTDDWLICGGGPKVSLWHLRSLECTTIFDFPGKAHVSGFLDETILCGGEYNNFYHFNFNGEIKSEIPISGCCCYSVIFQHEPSKIMSIAGASNKVDICTNFNYRDIVLNLYGKDL